MKMLQDAYLIDAVRTPIGKYGKSLATVRPDDMAAHVLSGLQGRQGPCVERLDHVVFGSTNQAGEDNRNVARMATLLSGLPYEVPAVTVNRLCGSGLEAVTEAVMRIWCADAEVVIAGGVESMTRAPYVYGKSERAFDNQAPKVYSTSLGWRFPNPRMEQRFSLDAMGLTAENIAEKWDISREAQDRFALGSHQKAAAARKAGAFDDEIIPIEVPRRRGDPVVIDTDESIRPDTSMEALAGLAPVFKEEGTVTAGNASPLNDGAAAVLVVSERVVDELGLEPMARVVSFATAGVHPNYMGEGPIPATREALERAEWEIGDLDLVELNEAFSSQSLACIRELGLDEALVNVNGGSIALGHPIGASGARVLTTLLHAMASRQARRGLATLCIGVGQGIAMLVEREG